MSNKAGNSFAVTKTWRFVSLQQLKIITKPWEIFIGVESDNCFSYIVDALNQKKNPALQFAHQNITFFPVMYFKTMKIQN